MRLPRLELPGLELPGLEWPGLEFPGLEFPGLELPGLELSPRPFLCPPKNSFREIKDEKQNKVSLKRALAPALHRLGSRFKTILFYLSDP